MEFSEETVRGLRLLADEALLSGSNFSKFVAGTFGAVLKESEEPTLSSGNQANLKLAFAGLATLILEAAKLNADGSEVKSTLEDHGVSLERCDEVSAAYNEKKESLRILLQRSGFSLPAIVGASWRLDYVVKSRHLDHINRPMYFIGFNTETQNGEQKKIEFTCNLEQLQDLVSKLEDATKQVARTVNKR